ncbi:hypothetical protein AAFF_G00173460 [Aldrovandia affinis]|uniref:Uncharacterized protein n=1 Tax=Aldrovandia affinis TaxID=143900 RepID=A0AAD7SZ60_9TELE|nr:hypothetical protein AAFF_G00173460 [Aldrovandia affinis]
MTGARTLTPGDLDVAGGGFPETSCALACGNNPVSSAIKASLNKPRPTEDGCSVTISRPGALFGSDACLEQSFRLYESQVLPVCSSLWPVRSGLLLLAFESTPPGPDFILTYFAVINLPCSKR